MRRGCGRGRQERAGCRRGDSRPARTPIEGADAARKLMALSWIGMKSAWPGGNAGFGLGGKPHAATRIALLQRFLEAFFLRQRNLNLEYFYP